MRSTLRDSIELPRSAERGATHERAAQRWRRAKSGRDAWRVFARWLSRTDPEEDTSDAPYWDAGMHGHSEWTGPKATQLVLFEKLHVMESFLPDGRGSTRSERWRVATHVVPFAPNGFDIDLIKSHARLVGGQIGFVGDFDPHGIHVFAALRSGRLAAPDLKGRALKLGWLGIDDAWLKRANRSGRAVESRLRRMAWIEREYWEVVKRLVPGVAALVGPQSFALLEEGLSLEADRLLDVLPAELRSRLGVGAGRG